MNKNKFTSIKDIIGTLSTEERVQKAVCQLQRDAPFFGFILVQMKVDEASVSEEKCPTFAVNKYGQLFYNKKFAEIQSDEQLKYILCHEALHLAKGDFFRIGDRIPMLWNIASDCIINHYCNQENLTPPRGMDEDDSFYVPDKRGNIKIGENVYNVIDKTTEELYDEIKDEFNIIKISIGSGDGHGGMDVHLEDDLDPNGKPTGEASRDGSGNITSASDQLNEKNWKNAAIEATIQAKNRGLSPGFAEEIIESLTESKINWKQALKSYLTNELPSDYMNRIPSRSFYGTGVWSPRLHFESIKVFLSVDCSGSTAFYREDFISECLGILTAHENVSGRLICWDTKVAPENDIEISSHSLDKFNKLNLKDISGGTTLSSYTQYVNQKEYTSRIHIVLTDGYIENNPELPQGRCLFVLTKDGDDSIIKKHGQVIRIE